MKSRVSVIVPVYNREKQIETCIESVLKQTHTEWELILVDDGSTDHSRERCQHYAEIDQRVIVLHQQNRGASAARNSGLKYATGEYILFVDSDDWIEEDLLETVTMKSQKYGADVVVFGWKCEGNKHTQYQITENDMVLSGREIVKKIIDDNYIYGGGYIWNKFWNRNVFEKTGVYFEETLHAYEDKVFAISNYLYLDRIAIISDVCYHYLIQDRSLSHPDNIGQYWRTEENVLCAHRKLAEICSVDPSLGKLAYIKYYAAAMQLMASAVKRKNMKYIGNSYSILKGHYQKMFQYKGWTIFCKIKYGLIFAGVTLYDHINKLEVEA